jgi:hypothetical protein
MTLDLNEAELRLKATAASGTVAKFAGPQDRTIRSEIIQMLCCGGQSDWPVSPEGVRAEGCIIAGRIDLSNREVKQPLVLRQAQISDGIDLGNSRTRTIDLSGSRIGKSQVAADAEEQAPFSAENMRVDGDLLLNETTISGGCTIAYARIAGRFSAKKATLNNAAGNAIRADSCSCLGFSLDGATLTGTCDISGARIKGDFAVEGSTFDCPEGAAIRAFSARIAAWFMSPLHVGETIQPTRVHGTIILTHTHIERDLDLTGAQLSAGYHLAIAARSLVVKGSVFIEQGAKVDGGIRFGGADIKGQLRLTNSVITSATLARNRGNDPLAPVPAATERQDSSEWTWHALDLSETKIGQLVMPDTEETRPRGIIDLSRARIGTLTDFKAAWPPKVDRASRACTIRPCDDHGRDADHLILDGFEYEHLDNPDGLPPNQTGPVAEARYDWLHGQSRDDIFERLRPQPWRHLGKVLSQQGYEDDARSIAIERRVAQRYAKGMPRAAKAISWTLHKLADYGFNPWKTIRWSAAVVVVFALLYLFPAIDYGSQTHLLAADQNAFARTVPADFVPGATSYEESKQLAAKVYPSFDPLMYSLDVFLPFVDLGMEKYWRANTTTWLGVLLYYLSVLEGIIGAILISLAVTGFTGLLTRDES